MGIDIVVRGPIHTVPYFLTQARGVNTCVDYHGDKISWEALVHLLVTVPNVADAVKEARANAKKETSKSDVDKMGKRIDLGKLMLVQEIDADTSWYDVSGKECGRKKQAVVDMWQLDEKRDKQAPRSDAMTRYAVWSDKCDDPKRLGCELRTTWNAVVSVKLVVRIGPRWKGDTDDLTFNASDYANGTDNTGTVAITDGYDGSGPPRGKVAHDRESQSAFLGGEVRFGATPPPGIDAFGKSVMMFDVPGMKPAAYTLRPVVIHCRKGSVRGDHALPGGGLVPAENVGGGPPPAIKMSQVEKFELDPYTSGSGKKQVKIIPTTRSVVEIRATADAQGPDRQERTATDVGGALRDRAASNLSVPYRAVGGALRLYWSGMSRRQRPGDWLSDPHRRAPSD